MEPVSINIFDKLTIQIPILFVLISLAFLSFSLDKLFKRIRSLEDKLTKYFKDDDNVNDKK